MLETCYATAVVHIFLQQVFGIAGKVLVFDLIDSVIGDPMKWWLGG